MNHPIHDLPDGVKIAVDAFSVTTLLGTLAGMLPHIAALLTIIWTAIRIAETETVRGGMKTVRAWFAKEPLE